MSDGAGRWSFQVAWSDDGGDYVGTALEFPALSHRSTTPEGALAGIRQLVVEAADDDLATGGEGSGRGSEMPWPLSCLVCGTALRPSPVDKAQPSNGVAVHIFGNYGSAVFDPSGDTTWLQAALCDSCLRSSIAAQRVLEVQRSPTIEPPPTYRTANAESTIGIVDDPHLM